LTAGQVDLAAGVLVFKSLKSGQHTIRPKS
jgi:hypothetical protein